MIRTKTAATGHTRSSVMSLGFLPLWLPADLSWAVATEVQESSTGREQVSLEASRQREMLVVDRTDGPRVKIVVVC